MEGAATECSSPVLPRRRTADGTMSMSHGHAAAVVASESELLGVAHDEELDDEEYHDTSSDHQPIDPSKHPITPGFNKRRQAAKLHMIQSPTDNIFSPISKKLLGRKRTDVVKELPEF